MESLEAQLLVRKTAKHNWNSSGHHVQKFLFRCFGPMQGENFTARNPWIIHPNSVASSVLLLMSGTLLIYSAIQVPLDIGFFWDSELCDGDIILLKFNVFVDTFFVFEILFNFFVGVWYKGEYCDSLAIIAYCYIKGRFIFDVLTSMPTSWFDLIAYNSCYDGKAESSSSVTDILKFIRLLKPLRLFKLLRIIKFAKIFDILDRILRISPQILQIAKLTFGVTLLVHLLACLFWLLKTQYDAGFKEFMVKFNVEEGVARKWLLSMYFVNTIFTTVGFGDISGTNDVERTFCIIVMWVGTGVFAIIINGLQQAGAEMNERNREKNQQVQKVVRFMRERSVPAWMEQEVQTWIAFHIDRNTAATERDEVLKSLPPKLRNSLVLQINSRMFSKSWVFGQLAHADSEQDDDTARAQNKKSKGQLIASHSEDCALPPPLSSQDDGSSAPKGARLYIVEIGAVALSVWLNGEEQMLEGKTLTRGHFFGERSLLGGKWGIPDDVQFEFRAIENTELISLDKATVDEVMKMFPEELRWEMEYHASRWRSKDPHVEDMRFQIELKLAIGASKERRGQRMRVLWEKLAYQLSTLHRKDGMMGNLLFTFSVPTRTANPLQAMRARPDWNIPSIRNSRASSSATLKSQKNASGHRSNSQLSVRSHARSNSQISRNGGQRTSSLLSVNSVEFAQAHVRSIKEHHNEAEESDDDRTKTLTTLESVHAKLSQYKGRRDDSESASSSDDEEHHAKGNGTRFHSGYGDQSTAQNESDDVQMDDTLEQRNSRNRPSRQRRVSISEVVVDDIPEHRPSSQRRVSIDDVVQVDDIPEGRTSWQRRVSIGDVVEVDDIPEHRNSRPLLVGSGGLRRRSVDSITDHCDLAVEPKATERKVNVNEVAQDDIQENRSILRHRVSIVEPSDQSDSEVEDIPSCNGNDSHQMTRESTPPETNMSAHDLDHPELPTMLGGDTVNAGETGARSNELEHAERPEPISDEASSGVESVVRTDVLDHVDRPEVQDDDTASGGESRGRTEDWDDAERSEVEDYDSSIGGGSSMNTDDLEHVRFDLQDDNRFASLLAPKRSSVQATSRPVDEHANDQLQSDAPDAAANQGTAAAALQLDLRSPTGTIETPIALAPASRQPVDTFITGGRSKDHDHQNQVPSRSDAPVRVTSEVVLVADKAPSNASRLPSEESGGHEERLGVMLENRANTTRRRTTLERFQSRIGLA
eukprot:CAMPEP_0181290624 /NCGR_PEP_ID=MMETSP1101-20121128/1514_1 /TAXON_ID=46948 /ORGANISM="Rhodomonas abbreviata, Strain Caron Lab Isolate" /LENGTH=1212 /DNA_ID=CAMNT_0023394923 /DNA_START=415 /DNA_END=4052 /DNA_ORIENTATION=-